MIKKPTDDSVSSKKILGVFEGESADANITNLNGMDITREVWENVFNSDEYANAIEHGWYIGFLGHPEDPNCMDFEHACIVMTEGHIDDNGKVYGKFNLIDTPVGRIVKDFIDAGVTFGISVRGAGDIINNSVDPDTFVFRGFDIVTFPAFPESIPTFTAVAASTDKVSQAKYKKVCASVDANMEGLNTIQSLEVVQSCFAKQSDTYNKLEEKKQAIKEAQEIEDEEIDITEEKVEGMTKLYMEERDKNKVLSARLAAAKQLIRSMKIDSRRKMDAVRRITAAQLTDMDNAFADLGRSRTRLNKEKAKAIAASKQFKDELESVQKKNLNYKRKIESATQDLQDKESVIASMQLKMNETVSRLKDAEAKVSNLDAANKRLTKEITASQKLVEEYQDAYASIYASALGVKVDSIPVTASTSVTEMQSLLNSKVTVTAAQSIDPTPVEIDSFDDDGDELVTM